MEEIRNLTQHLEEMNRDEITSALMPLTSALMEMDRVIARFSVSKKKIQEEIRNLLKKKPHTDSAISDSLKNEIMACVKDAIASSTPKKPSKTVKKKEYIPEFLDATIPKKSCVQHYKPGKEPEIPDPYPVNDNLLEEGERYRVINKFGTVCLNLQGLDETVLNNFFQEVKSAIPHRERAYIRQHDIWRIKEEHKDRVLGIARKYGLPISPKVR